MTDHPITPSPELVTSLRNSAPHGIRGAGVTRETWLIHNAYALGADQELEACCEWFKKEGWNSCHPEALRAARRPKPPSLKEQALAALQEAAYMADDSPPQGICSDQIDIIRRALENIDD